MLFSVLMTQNDTITTLSPEYGGCAMLVHVAVFSLGSAQLVAEMLSGDEESGNTSYHSGLLVSAVKSAWMSKGAVAFFTVAVIVEVIEVTAAISMSRIQG